MKSFSTTICLIWVVLCLFTGCAGLPTSIRKPFIKKETALIEQYQNKAMALEQQGDLQTALSYWQAAHCLNPKDVKFSNKIISLTDTIEKKAEEHFQKGMVYYRKKYFRNARREFLTTLRFNPNHQKAPVYLKTKLIRKSSTPYTVQKGDTLSGIALRFYKDPDKSLMIARLNDIHPTEVPVSGTTLILPILETIIARPAVNIEDELSQAKTCFKAKDYETVLTITKRILEYDSLNPDAAELRNAGYLEMGKVLFKQGKLLDSLIVLKNADPDYQGIDDEIRKVDTAIKIRVTAYYRKGIRFYLKEDLESAVKEWEKVLALDPDHRDAKNNIEKTTRILKNIETFN